MAAANTCGSDGAARTFRVMRRTAAAVSLVMALSACGAAQSTGSGDDRCTEVEKAGEAQATAVQDARDRATKAKGDEQRAESALRQADIDAGYPGTPELNAAATQARRERNAAQQAREVAEADALRQYRLAAQIIVGDPECFDPTTVARAREALD